MVEICVGASFQTKPTDRWENWRETAPIFDPRSADRSISTIDCTTNPYSILHAKVVSCYRPTPHWELDVFDDYESYRHYKLGLKRRRHPAAVAIGARAMVLFMAFVAAGFWLLH